MGLSRVQTPQKMNILGIETSCDESGVALVQLLPIQPQVGIELSGLKPFEMQASLKAHALHTQIAMHQPYGGVVPELASRDHIQRVHDLVEAEGKLLETTSCFARATPRCCHSRHLDDDELFPRLR
jgi:tRNA A37 threonylcarbamoyltransferase TsaD